MNRNIISLFNVVLLVGALFLASCQDDEIVDQPKEFPPIDRGSIEANRFLLTFIAKSDSSNNQTVEFYDPDGAGGAAPTIQEELSLKKPSGSFFTYTSTIRFFKDTVDVTEQIIDHQTQYIICYRNFDTQNLRNGEINEDVNGLPLGTFSKWSTLDKLGNDGTGSIFITLNYQGTLKDGRCDAGIRILQGNVPYQIN